MSNDLSPKQIREIIRGVSESVIDALAPKIAAAGAVDLTILELNPDTGQVCYAADPQNLYLDPWVVGFDTLSENAKITIRHNCGSKLGGGIGNLPPGGSMEPDPDPSLVLPSKGPGQFYGFVSPCYPCFADPTVPQGYSREPDMLQNTVALRFPSTETAIRKALKG